MHTVAFRTFLWASVCMQTWFNVWQRRIGVKSKHNLNSWKIKFLDYFVENATKYVRRPAREIANSASNTKSGAIHPAAASCKFWFDITSLFLKYTPTLMYHYDLIIKWCLYFGSCFWSYLFFARITPFPCLLRFRYSSLLRFFVSYVLTVVVKALYFLIVSIVRWCCFFSH